MVAVLLLLQVLSNTRYKSVLHRAAVNGFSKRLSLACFLNPPLSATVEAPQELITEERPQVYRPFTWHEYLTNAYKFHPATGGERHERFFRWKMNSIKDHHPHLPDSPNSKAKVNAWGGFHLLLLPILEEFQSFRSEEVSEEICIRYADIWSASSIHTPPHQSRAEQSRARSFSLHQVWVWYKPKFVSSSGEWLGIWLLWSEKEMGFLLKFW